MTPPGSRLLALASRWCSAATLTRVVEPLVADLQAEHHAALAQGRTWRAGWIRAAAVVAFVKVLALSAGADLCAWGQEWSEDDGRGLRRVLLIGLLTATVFVVLLTLSPGWPYATRLGHSKAHLIALLVPQALPVAMPWAATWAVLFGLGGCRSSLRLRAAVVGLAVVGSFSTWVWLGWVVPESNQAFRVVASGGLVIARGNMELTRPNLRARVADLNRDWLDDPARRATIVYYRRDALPWATTAVAMLALAILPRRRPGGWVLAVLACGLTAVYWAAFVMSEQAVRQEAIPALLGAWIPNLTFVMAAIAWLVARRRRTAASLGAAGHG